jgi:hypothetical protein
MQPDVLLLDEVLAVGDNEFRAKCLNTVTETLKDAAVIFVSHNENQVKRICDQALLLTNGRVEQHSSDVFDALLSYNEGTSTESGGHDPQWATPKADILSYSITPDVSAPQSKIGSTDSLTLRIKARAKEPLGECLALMLVQSSSGDIVAGYQSDCDDSETMVGGAFELVFQIDSLKLATGHYSFDFYLLNRTDLQIIFKARELFSVSVIARFIHGGLVAMDAKASLSLSDNPV